MYGTSEVQKSRTQGRHGDYILCGGAKYLWAPSKELASCHPSGIYILEVAPSFWKTDALACLIVHGRVVHVTHCLERILSAFLCGVLYSSAANWCDVSIWFGPLFNDVHQQ